jgi:hypothetical protein
MESPTYNYTWIRMHRVPRTGGSGWAFRTSTFLLSVGGFFFSFYFFLLIFPPYCVLTCYYYARQQAAYNREGRGRNYKTAEHTHQPATGPGGQGSVQQSTLPPQFPHPLMIQWFLLSTFLPDSRYVVVKYGSTEEILSMILLEAAIPPPMQE